MTDILELTPAQVQAKANADAAAKAQEDAAHDAKLKAEADAKAAALAKEEAEAKAKANADAAAALKAIDPKNIATHPLVMATTGSHCMVKGCNWTFGDPVKGIEPHPTTIVTIKPPPIVGPPLPVPPIRPESTAKCEPVGIMNECPTCGWNATDSAEPHPVIA